VLLWLWMIIDRLDGILCGCAFIESDGMLFNISCTTTSSAIDLGLLNGKTTSCNNFES